MLKKPKGKYVVLFGSPGSTERILSRFNKMRKSVPRTFMKISTAKAAGKLLVARMKFKGVKKARFKIAFLSGDNIFYVTPTQKVVSKVMAKVSKFRKSRGMN